MSTLSPLLRFRRAACLPHTTTRCHSVRLSQSSEFGFFHEVFVATDNTRWLLPLPFSFRSGSAPRNPINCALFVSIMMFQSPFFRSLRLRLRRAEPHPEPSLLLACLAFNN